jgi:hypothetical protein
VVGIVPGVRAGLSATPGVDPEVDMLLGGLGLGALASRSAQGGLAGRNHNWAGTTDLGRQIFVKKFLGHRDDAAGRLRRSLAFEEMAGRPAATGQAAAAGQADSGGLAAPRCLGWDEQAQLIVFEFIEQARSGAELAGSAEFSEDLAHRAGMATGALHSRRAPDQAVTGSGPESGDARPLLPSLELLEGLPLEVFAACSAAELQAWHLMQHDAPLVGAVRELLSLERSVAWVPAHCDLRLEQLLVAGDRLYLCDWEEFRLADPARDVGSFAGEWLHRAVLGVAGKGDKLSVGEALSHDDVIQTVTSGIDKIRPTITAFWSGYRRTRPVVDPGMAERAVRYAGWHLFDRMLAIARRSPRLGALDRAGAGIGRAALLTPGDFVATLGLAG